MFIDFDCYFAGVEMMDNPVLRGRPIVITPTPDYGVLHHVQLRARAFGIKTGCRFSDARKLCPEVVNVRARPARYIEVHHQPHRGDRVSGAYHVGRFGGRMLGPPHGQRARAAMQDLWGSLIGSTPNAA